jgi:membrane protein YdbS with pleckstrin-like domain
MTFTNLPVSLSAIPILESIPEQRLEPRYRTTNIVIRLVVFLMVSGLLSIARFQTFTELSEDFIDLYPTLVTIVAVLASISIVYHFFADPKKTYKLREQDICYSAGLFFRKTVCQPILRIQHIELSRGPIERLVGLATLQVFSAGGSAHTFKVPGLLIKDAQSIRKFILDHKDVVTNG